MISDWKDRKEPDVLHFVNARESMRRVETTQSGDSISVQFAAAIGIITALCPACYPRPLVLLYLTLLSRIDKVFKQCFPRSAELEVKSRKYGICTDSFLGKRSCLTTVE
jgi:hypothetical protein